MRVGERPDRAARVARARRRRSGSSSRRRGPGMHHVAFEVADVGAELERLAGGRRRADRRAAAAAASSGSRSAFVHPRRDRRRARGAGARVADGDRIRLEIAFEGGAGADGLRPAGGRRRPRPRARRRVGGRVLVRGRGRPLLGRGAQDRLREALRAREPRRLRRDGAEARPSGRGARGRDRRASRRREDDAVHGADARRRAASTGRRTSAWRAIADERLDALAEVVHAKKVTPATIRVQDVPGTGPALLGNLRQVDALLVVLDGFSPGADPAGDLETLRLELLVADRDHVERRLERVEKQAKSGDAKLRAEVEELRKVLAHVDGEAPLSDYPGELPARARAADDEAAARGRERAGRDRPRRSRPSSPSSPTRRRPRSATAAPRRSRRSSAGSTTRSTCHVLHRGREGDARVDAPERRDGARRGRDDPLRHRPRLHPLRGDRLVATSSRPARTPRRRGAALQRLEGKTYVVRDGDVLNIRFNV